MLSCPKPHHIKLTFFPNSFCNLQGLDKKIRTHFEIIEIRLKKGREELSTILYAIFNFSTKIESVDD
jgi:hypothetical protein